MPQRWFSASVSVANCLTALWGCQGSWAHRLLDKIGILLVKTGKMDMSATHASTEKYSTSPQTLVGAR